VWIAAPTTQGVNFLPKFAAVVHEKAKLQQSTCHYCPSRAEQLGDLWIVASTTHEQRSGVNFFLQILSSRNLAVRETSKQQKYNNARAIIVPLDQDIWAICGSLRQRLKSGTTA